MKPYEAFAKKPFPRRRSVLERLADSTGLTRLFLREGRRPHIRAGEDIIVSPAECRLREIQPLRAGGEMVGKQGLLRAEHYTFEEIVHGTEMREAFEQGLCFNLYLSPLNLHYLLYPVNLRVLRLRHHPAFCRPICFMKSGEIRNERLVIYAETPQGIPLVIVLVGSFLVSGIECLAEEGGEYLAGELMGGFKLGSTVLLLCPRDCVKPLAQPRDSLFLGEPLARLT